MAAANVSSCTSTSHNNFFTVDSPNATNLCARRDLKTQVERVEDFEDISIPPQKDTLDQQTPQSKRIGHKRSTQHLKESSERRHTRPIIVEDYYEGKSPYLVPN